MEKNIPENLLSALNQAMTDCEAMRKSLREYEVQFRAVFDLDLVGMAQSDPKTGRFLRVSGKFCDITGYSASELLALDIMAITHPEDRQHDWTCFQRVVRGEAPHYRNEKRYVRKDGAVVWVNVNMTIVRDEAGQPWRSMATIEDITERKRAEEALRQKEAELNEAQRIAHIGSWLWDPQTDTLTVTDELMRNYGLDPATQQMPSFQALRGTLFPIESWERLNAAVQQAMRTGIGYELDLEALRDGAPIWIATRSEAVRDAEGRIVGLRGTSQDITMRKRAEEALRESQARFAEAERMAHMGAWELDLQTHELYWSDEVYRIFGYAPGEFGATHEAFMETMHPDDRERLSELLDQALRGEEPFLIDHRIVRPDGSIRFVQEKAEIIRDEAGKPIRMLGIVLDITERKEAEVAIRESEEKYRQLFVTVSDAVSIFDAQTHLCVDLNESALQLYGYSREEMLRQKYDDLTAQWPQSRESVEATLSGVRQYVPLRYHRKKDGTVFPVEISSTTFFWRNRQMICGVVRDITERLRAEDALRQSEEQYRTLVESAGEAISTVDEKGLLTFMNSTAAGQLGGTPEAYSGKTLWEVFPEAIANRQAANVRRVIESGEGMVTDSHVIIHNQSRWFHASLAPLKDHTGKVIAALVIARDVTDRKVAEAEISRLAAIVASSNDAIFSITLEGVFTSWNTGAERLFKYSVGEVIGKSIYALPAIGRWDEVEQIMERITRGEHIAPLETVWQRRGGQRIHISLTVSPIRNKAGDLVGVSMIAGDITERLALEQAVLEVSSREHRRIGQELHDSVGQNLTGIGYMARSLVQSLEGKALPEAKLASRIAEGLDQALGEIRAVARGLIPVEVDADGLRSALEELALVTSARYGISCVCESDRPIQLADNEIATHLYRITQEAITNAVKHGKARHIQIILAGGGGGSITLQVIDDGVGTQKDLLQGKGAGLQIMHYRASLTGGRMAIEPAPGGGTQVTVTLHQAADVERGHDESTGETQPNSDRG